jgi:type VI secretion system secreted protein Hcp
MPIFMQYGDIQGDVKSQGHENWIQLSSFQWGINRGINSAVASGADREGCTPTVNEIVITKDTDSSSTNLMRAALGLKPAGEGKDCLIHFCKSNEDSPEGYIEVTLSNTLVSGWSVSGGGGDDARPSEVVTLNFTKVEFKNTPMDPSNAPGGGDTAQYDLTTQTGG